MQIHALDENQLISVERAEKKRDYRCPECKSPVRLRSGAERAPHFYHLNTTLKCRLAKKGLIHLKLQHLLVSLLPGAEMEKRFETIDRIADVYHNGTVYEIQYSPMSLEEGKARTQDYESLGLQIVWILHDHTYSPFKLKPLQRFLRTRPGYFASHDVHGRGEIYDQVPPLPPSPVDLTQKHPLPKMRWPRRWPKHLHNRSKCWKHYHNGDLFALYLSGD